MRDLLLRVRALLRPRRVERELEDELAFHIEAETSKLVAAGMKPADARASALARFGSRTAHADACRDERGVGGVETLVRDVQYAIRAWLRAPLAAMTIVLTVALGLALVTIVFTGYSALFLRTDAVPRPGELFELRRPPVVGSDAWVPFTRTEFEAFRRETTVFGDEAAITSDFAARLDGRPLTAVLVSGNFFNVVDVAAAHGRALTPTDDRADAPPAIVLSDRGWAKVFMRDPAVVGRTLRVNGVVVEIVGVMPEGFRGLNVGTPDFWAPLAANSRFRPSDDGREADIPVEVIGRLRPGQSEEAAASGVRVWAAGPGLKRIAGRPVTIVLRPRTGVSPDLWEATLVFSPIFFAFGLILLIGCANVANLLLARGIARQQELGVRLSLGATRLRIVRQLLTEGLLLGLAAAALAYPISRLLATGVLSVVLGSAPPEYAEQIDLTVPAADWRVVIFLIAGAMAATVLFALMPALQATRLDPVRTIRGELLQDVRPGRARSVLIGAQVLASTLLLICSAVFLRGAFAASRVEPGVRVSDTVVVTLANESRRSAVLAALSTEPVVSMVSASSPRDGRFATVRATDTGIVAPHAYQLVSSDYFAVMGIDVARGRAFSADERGVESGVAIVSSGLADRMWPGGDALGRTIRASLPSPAGDSDAEKSGPAPQRIFTIIGIAHQRPENYAFSDGAPDLYLPTEPTSAGTQLMLRVRDEPLRARALLLDRLTAVDPALGNVRTMQSIFRGLETILRIAFIVTVLLGGLALLLTASGLFSVLSYVVQQRTREIGVRMALGASARAVAGMVVLESARPVGLGLAGGVLLAGSLSGALMASPAASEVGGMVQVLDPISYASSLIVIAVACVISAAVPAWRAARVNPMTTLRKD